MPFKILLTLAVVLFTCGYALKFGDRVIKLAAVWIFGNIFVHGLLGFLHRVIDGDAQGHFVSPTFHLITDGVYATGLLPLAFFSVSPSIGALACFACASFALQSYYLLADRQTDMSFVMINDSLTMACLLTLFAGATASILSRRRDRARMPAGLATA